MVGGTENSKLEMRRGLFSSNFAGDDVCQKIILTAYWVSREAAQHRQLPHVRQRISNSALKQLLRGAAQRVGRRQVIIKRLQTREEPCHFLIPRSGVSFLPFFFSFGNR